MKKYFLALAILVALFSCDSKDKTTLQNKVDSLSARLTEGVKVEKCMYEVGTIIDLIYSSGKHSLQIKMMEVKNDADYLSRLSYRYVRASQTEVAFLKLERSNSNASKA